MTRTIEDVARDLAECSTQLKAWEDRRKTCIAELEALHDAGQAPDKFLCHGNTYTRQAGRLTYDYSNAPNVTTITEQLKEAQEVAKATGIATIKHGAAFWRVSVAND